MGQVGAPIFSPTVLILSHSILGRDFTFYMVVDQEDVDTEEKTSKFRVEAEKREDLQVQVGGREERRPPS